MSLHRSNSLSLVLKKNNHMKTRTITFTKYILTALICLFISIQTSFAQKAKKTPAKTSAAKPAVKSAVKDSKAPVKATITSDMDCTVKINGAAKLITLKANTPASAVLKLGENSIEALGLDKKSTYKNTITAAPGETKIISVSFLGGNRFLEYIKEGNITMVETSIKKNPAFATNEGEILATSPIEMAIENSQFEIIKLLISKGASFIMPYPIYPLHKSILFASSEKSNANKPAADRELVDYFLSVGCKITDRDSTGNTPLHCASQAGKLDLVMYLIAKGADINVKNNLGITPIKIAEDNGEISIISLFKAKAVQEKALESAPQEMSIKKDSLGSKQ